MLTRLRRYLKFGFQYYLLEKPRGLDFTMRDMSPAAASHGLCHGYSKTDEKHLKEIFAALSFTGEERLLDIGCGKGVVLRAAAGYPFAKVAGIEIDERLAAIAVKIFKILNIEDKVECICADAAEFDDYDSYNVFFLFNPFPEIVMEQVIDKLLKTAAKNPVTIIYHNPVCISLFEAKAEIRCLKRLHDKRKNYDTYIFRIAPPV